MIKSDFSLENKLLEKGFEVVIGIDEAGRGPLAGPVVACAATVRNDKFQIPPLAGNFQANPNDQISKFKKQMDLIRDSKTLSIKQRDRLFDFIRENFYIGIGICDHKTIDKINILEASFLAMKKAVTALFRNLQPASRKAEKIILLLDGNKKMPNWSLEQKAIVDGDKTVKSISAASIAAKVTRDRIMLEMNEKYPQYRFDKHKGYGTKLHMEMLRKYGPSEIHRKTFKPVAGLVKKEK